MTHKQLTSQHALDGRTTYAWGTSSGAKCTAGRIAVRQTPQATLSSSDLATIAPPHTPRTIVPGFMDIASRLHSTSKLVSWNVVLCFSSA